MKIKRYGWVADLPDHRDHIYSAPVQVVTSLPTKVDLSSQCPAVYDQGQLGSCTANAIAGAIEFDLMKEKKQDFMPSRLFIYYNERDIEGTVDSDSGAQIRDGIKSIASQGDCPEKEWSYDISKFAQKPPQKCYDDALKHKAVQYQRITRT
jgi:C1A family cysteine protease